MHGRTLYDAAHEKGLTTAQVDWVAILNAPSITWEFPERPDPKGGIAQEAVKAGILSQADLEGFASKNILWRDRIWTMAAAHIIRQHRPNLMLFHLLNLDSTQHRYGPQDAGRHGRDGPPRHAGRHDPAGRAGQPASARVPRCSSCRTMASRP